MNVITPLQEIIHKLVLNIITFIIRIAQFIRPTKASYTFQIIDVSG